MNKDNVLIKAIAVLDSAIISLREQQIALTKKYAEEENLHTDSVLNALKLSSLELLEKNGLEY